MRRYALTMIVGAALAALPSQARADISGFLLNSIKGVGEMEDKIQDRLKEDLMISYADCILYLGEGSVSHAEGDEETGRVDEGEPYVPDHGTYEDVTEETAAAEDTAGDSRSPLPGGFKADDIAGEEARILVTWSLSALSGYDYAIKVGSCSDTGSLTDEESSTCKYLVSRTELDSFTNNEVYVPLRDLLPDGCVSGDSGEAGLYFFVQWGDDTLTKQVQVVTFPWDFDPPGAPTNVMLEAGEQNVKVAWEDESNSDEVEYNLFWTDKELSDDEWTAAMAAGEIESKTGVSAKEYQITGLENGVEVFVRLSAMDDYENESALTEMLSATPVSVDDFWEYYKGRGGQEEGGFCFVATAAWGTPMARSVGLLRQFRDRFLLGNAWGRKLTDLYYAWGPDAAAAIRHSPAARLAARIALAPAVAVAWLLVEAGWLERLALAAALAALAALALAWRRRRTLQTAGRRRADGRGTGPTRSSLVVLAAAAAFACAAFPARATAEETPQTMAMEFRLGFYAPDIDSEFDAGEKPFDRIFGSDTAMMLGFEFDSQVWHGFGSLGVFGISSYGYLSGKGIETGKDAVSADETTMSFIPFVAGLVYRFDILATRFNIPVMFAFKGGADYTIWWIRDGVEEISDFSPDQADPAADNVKGEGGTWGLYGSVSMHLLLDFFEPHTAKVFDNDLGVNNSYLFAEYAWTRVDDFGSDSSFDLSGDGLVFGLAFEM